MSRKTSKAEAAIEAFRVAAQRIAGLNWKVQHFMPTHDPITDAEYRRLKKTYEADKAMWDERWRAVHDLRQAAPAILRMLKKHRLDATAIYRFVRDAQWPRRRRFDPTPTLDVDAVLDNLRLTIHPGDPPMPGDAAPLDDTDLAILRFLASQRNGSAKIIDIRVSKDRTVVGDRIRDKLIPSKFVERIGAADKPKWRPYYRSWPGKFPTKSPLNPSKRFAMM